MNHEERRQLSLATRRIYSWRHVILVVIALFLVCSHIRRSRLAAEASVGARDICEVAEDEFDGLSRHKKRRRRHELLAQVGQLPEQMARLERARTRESVRALQNMQRTVAIARCVAREAELPQVEEVEAQLARLRPRLVPNATAAAAPRRLSE